ncbi:M23 family metallopeptidase [Nakamurella endophytica]|uniref:Peptidase M23 n=1 Tax=Nakamurella endophytica TaxID=1748367 RepID=A0A917SK77_9ACTN|nr:M23 family metallopeptidase [Nakamurella endophytica]GGL86583.1 peptidase M23 [Nakamurella endophytica]
MQVLSTPRWFTGSDGKAHVVYEVQLTNAFPSSATLVELSAVDAASGATLADLRGSALAAAVSPLGRSTERLTEMGGGTVGVAWMELVVDRPADVPARIVHRLTVTVPPGYPIPERITSQGAASEVAAEPAMSLGPPLRGTGWIAAPSCCDGPHRRALQPIDNAEWLAQRFAIDFNKIDARHLLAGGDPAVNRSWFTYGQDVLAVADATVTAAVDGYRDQTPDAPRPVTIEEADGNHVILEVAPGRYAFYAHLEPGSVAVRPGQRVRRGDVIGRAGNTGSSSGPHLHFHLMDRPSALVADGVPFVFDRFTVTGQAPPLDRLIALDPAKDPVEVDPAGAGPRTDALPLDGNVVDFPGR